MFEEAVIIEPDLRIQERNRGLDGKSTKFIDRGSAAKTLTELYPLPHHLRSGS